MESLSLSLSLFPSPYARISFQKTLTCCAITVLFLSRSFFLGETIAEAGKEALNRNNTIEKIRERDRTRERKNIEEEKDFVFAK